LLLPWNCSTAQLHEYTRYSWTQHECKRHTTSVSDFRNVADVAEDVSAVVSPAVDYACWCVLKLWIRRRIKAHYIAVKICEKFQ